MSKKLKSKAELTEMSAAYFEAYPDEEIFLATPDGQFFTEKNKSQANSHAKSMDAKVVVIERVEKAEVKELVVKPEDVKEAVAGAMLEAVTKITDEDTPPPAAPPQGGDTAGSGEANEAIEVKADGTERVLEVATPSSKEATSSEGDTQGSKEQVLDGDANTPDPAGQSSQVDIEKPEYKWTMEKMADWMNKTDGDFDLKDDKSTLWKKVKAHYEKITGEG